MEVDRKSYEKQVILADVNVPYNFCINRHDNCLFFCINADEFSEDSFHSVVLDLHTGSSRVIPSIRNGFASAVDQTTGTVYLGGSNGIYLYDSLIRDINKPALVSGIDIFNMYFHDGLYFVDTANQNLHVYKNNKSSIIPELKKQEIEHFVIDEQGNVLFINSRGLFKVPKGSKRATLYCVNNNNFRGFTLDIFGVPHIMAQDGIYTINGNKQLVNIFVLDNGYGLAFDKDNNIIYSDERTVNKLILREK